MKLIHLFNYQEVQYNLRTNPLAISMIQFQTVVTWLIQSRPTLGNTKLFGDECAESAWLINFALTLALYRQRKRNRRTCPGICTTVLGRRASLSNRLEFPLNDSIMLINRFRVVQRLNCSVHRMNPSIPLCTRRY